MMFGLREPFSYGECGECDSLQLLTVPGNLGRYYPADYYSLQLLPRPRRVVRRLAKRLRAEAAVRGHDRIARLIGLGAPVPEWSWWLRHAGVDRRAEICDIGCGNGDQLLGLKDQGFTRLTGADAFIETSTVREGVLIHKATPNEVPGTYDMVMLNHSFEHMPEPGKTLASLRRLVRPGGTLMLRIPIAGCAAWRIYGTDWVALDAPRHFHIPSARGMTGLAAGVGLEVRDVVFDSTAMQFWRSEQYRADIPLFDPRSYQVNPRGSMFSPAQLAAWKQQARDLNALNDGDTAAFFLRRSPA
jgi:SAM-dependent methyltransferase